MATMAPTPEEQARIDRLLEKYDVRTRPETGFVNALSVEKQAEIAEYARAEAQRRIEIALGINVLLGTFHDDGYAGGTDAFKALEDAFSTLIVMEPETEISRKANAILDLFNGPGQDWIEGASGKLNLVMSGPAEELVRFDEIKRQMVELRDKLHGDTPMRALV